MLPQIIENKYIRNGNSHDRKFVLAKNSTENFALRTCCDDIDSACELVADALTLLALACVLE